MGRFLKEQHVHPDRLVASPATRAMTTATLIASELGYPPEGIDPEPGLYGAGVRDTLEIVQAFPDEWASAMIFGHNPTTTSFVNWLSNAAIDNVPTCGVAHIRLDDETWTRLGDAAVELVGYYVPKNLPND